MKKKRPKKGALPVQRICFRGVSSPVWMATLVTSAGTHYGESQSLLQNIRPLNLICASVYKRVSSWNTLWPCLLSGIIYFVYSHAGNEQSDTCVIHWVINTPNRLWILTSDSSLNRSPRQKGLAAAETCLHCTRSPLQTNIIHSEWCIARMQGGRVGEPRDLVLCSLSD